MNKLREGAIRGAYCWGGGRHLGEWDEGEHRYCIKCKDSEDTYKSSLKAINDALESIARLMAKRRGKRQ